MDCLQLFIAHLENPSAEPDSSTLNPVGSKLDTSESIGNEYGVSKGSVVRLIRINKLTDELKALVDSGDIAIRTGVELSFLSEDTQAVVAECAEECKIDMKNAKKLRASADSEGNIAPDTVHAILYGEDTEPKVKPNFGKLITPNFVTTHFKYIIKKNKLKHIRFHDLRHSCASLLLANGVSMKAIQEWLGHSTFNVTANFYSHLDFHSKVESAETIAKVLGGDSTDTEQAIHDKGSEDEKNRKSST